MSFDDGASAEPAQLQDEAGVSAETSTPRPRARRGGKAPAAPTPSAVPARHQARAKRDIRAGPAWRTLNDEGEGSEMDDVEMTDAPDHAPRPRQPRRLPPDSDEETVPTPTGAGSGAAADSSGAAQGRARRGAAARQVAAQAVLTAMHAASSEGGQAGTSQPSGSQLPAAHAADGRHDAMLHRVTNGEGGIMRQIVQHEQDRVMAAAVADTAVSRPSGPSWGDVLGQPPMDDNGCAIARHTQPGRCVISHRLHTDPSARPSRAAGASRGRPRMA